MYNLYTHEKLQQNLSTNSNSHIKSKSLTKKRKLQLNQLTSNYEQRVKNFITDVYIYTISIFFTFYIDDNPRSSHPNKRQHHNNKSS